MKPGRNDPCPCGSGRKYKRCHGLAPGNTADTPPQQTERQLLGLARRHQESGDLRSAETLLREALARNDRSTEALAGLGALLYQQGRLREAEEMFRTQTVVAPRQAPGHCNLGVTLLGQGRAAEAAEALRRATAIQPRYASALANLGAALKDLGRFDEAERFIRDALAINNSIPGAHSNLGALLLLRHDPSAMASLDRALAIEPRSPHAYFNRASLLKDQGRIAESISSWRRAIALAPVMLPAWSNLLLTMLYSDSISPVETFDWHRRFDAVLARMRGHAEPRHRNLRDSARRLRIAYLSPDLRRHSVAHFLEPLLEHHDRAGFEVVCYHDSTLTDEFSARLEALADRWIDTSAMSHRQLAATIASQDVDVLIDLAGHTGVRAPCLARKPAAVQATWLGYPASTGLSTIDYRITDLRCDPPGSEALHSERLARLPGGSFCYRPPEDAPQPNSSPLMANGHVTFGSFNNIAKVTPTTLAMWASVLNALPDSRLLLKAAGLAYDSVRERLAAELEVLGVQRHRVDFEAWKAESGEHLAAYGKIDVALDTTPYNGATTTCEALWMGVPVVSLAGDRSQSRMGASILTAADCAAWVAVDAGEFVSIATSLAKDRGALPGIRAGLRGKLAASPLLDGRRFACEFEAALRSMWDEWCRSE